MYLTLTCEVCQQEIARKSQKQKYCLQCSIKKKRSQDVINKTLATQKMKVCPECKCEYKPYARDQIYCTKQCRTVEYERKINEKWVKK